MSQNAEAIVLKFRCFPTILVEFRALLFDPPPTRPSSPAAMYTPDLSDTEMELESMSARSSFGSVRSSISGGRRSSTGSMARTPLGVVDNFQRRASIGISFDNVSQMKKNTNGDLACVVAKRANLDEVQAEKDEVLAQRGLEERARPSAWLLRMRAVLV